jgi:hypothetical protein
MMAKTPGATDVDVVANVKPRELCLLDIESIRFFSWYRTTSLTLGNLNWQKWVPRDFSKNNLS